MTAQQRIVRVRRNYNQWVANQTLEDYALRFTAKRARRWSTFSVANTAIGAVSFLALEATGGSITINYGFLNATSAILVVGALIFLTSLPVAYYAGTYGVDIDLLILICEMMTKAPVKASASWGEENTYWNPTRYICVGSAAFSTGTRCSIARKARNEPASIFRTPGTIQPGPAHKYATHQLCAPRVPRGGRNRRKSTCSPI